MGVIGVRQVITDEFTKASVIDKACQVIGAIVEPSMGVVGVRQVITVEFTKAGVIGKVCQVIGVVVEL